MITTKYTSTAAYRGWGESDTSSCQLLFVVWNSQQFTVIKDINSISGCSVSETVISERAVTDQQQQQQQQQEDEDEVVLEQVDRPTGGRLQHLL